MTNDNWDEIVVKKNNFDLNSLVNKDFLDELEKIAKNGVKLLLNDIYDY